MGEQKRPTLVFFTLLVFSLVIFFLDHLGVLLVARGMAEEFLNPKVKEARQTFQRKLDEERLEMSSKLSELESIKKQNEDLRLQLGIREDPKSELILANVLSTARGFIIDKGQDDGVRVGNTVVFKNIFVGKVVVAGKHTSRILLPTDATSTINVLTTKTKAKGLARSQGGRAVLTEVFLSENLSRLDTVETIGDVDEKGLGVRPGFLVGTIENIRKSENQIYQEAEILPLLDYRGLKTVFVLL